MEKVRESKYLFIDASSLVFKNSFAQRTHDCGQLRHSDVGLEVQLCGWIQYNRAGKFLLLRDANGLTQIIFNPEKVRYI